jgi:hypothetical protein
MRQFHTAVVERQRFFAEYFETHPYEAGWASEAIFFVRVEQIESQSGSGQLCPRVQISADGVNWIDEGTQMDPISAEGNYFVRVSHFGGWLRLIGPIEGSAARFKLTVQLVLKE